MVVAVIPPGTSLDATLNALHGMGSVYPTESLFLSNDNRTGGMLILHNPDAQPSEADSPVPQMRVALGDNEPGDLLTYAMSVSGHDQQEGAKALGAWLAEQLEAAGAANYLTYSIIIPNTAGYAVTIQRLGGVTPGERIAELTSAATAP